MKLNNHNHNN